VCARIESSVFALSLVFELNLYSGCVCARQRPVAASSGPTYAYSFIHMRCIYVSGVPVQGGCVVVVRDINEIFYHLHTPCKTCFSRTHTRCVHERNQCVRAVLTDMMRARYRAYRLLQVVSRVWACVCGYHTMTHNVRSPHRLWGHKSTLP
jgi:hypothetical protein